MSEQLVGSGSARIAQFRAQGTSLILDATGTGIPRILHWGADLGDLSVADLTALRWTGIPLAAPSTVDVPVPLSILPEQSAGWMGTPGLAGHRHGREFSTRFTLRDWTSVRGARGSGGTAQAVLVDDAAALRLRIDIELTTSGLVKVRAVLTNIANSGDFTLDSLTMFLPVPARAAELLDFTGRHLRERSPQRLPFRTGVHRREGRRGRTGLDATLLLAAGAPGFGFGHGQVWTIHTAWSGNHLSMAERTPQGHSLLAGGELLLPGEIILAPGEDYESPWVFGSFSADGLDRASHRYHAYLRGRPAHARTPRPVVLNTWEAVYFDHDLAKLRELADLGAKVGAERYVLDDGWFRHRRNDWAGLGDWYVDEDVWPDGLSTIATYVKDLGMEFGLWVEPEMISVDSDVARAHPDWIMSPGDRLPLEGRHQQVIDVANREVYGYLLERLDLVLSQYPIDFLKWDHNRDLVEAGHASTGRAGVHDQTLAAYRLMDELKARHPGLEIESCSSGGARADLEVLTHTDRIWASDCIDALERQQIQRWTGLLVPPEMMGAHVGAGQAHTTGRIHDLDFRAGTALFGHFGIEWDLTSATEQDVTQLSEWVAIYKRFRDLIHHGVMVHSDHPDPAYWAHGVVSENGSEGLFAFVAIATGQASPPGLVTLPGLDRDRRYQLAPVVQRHATTTGTAMGAPPWWTTKPILTGATLADLGVQAPALFPEHLALVHVTALDAALP